jgi:hypothetical protein
VISQQTKTGDVGGPLLQQRDAGRPAPVPFVEPLQLREQKRTVDDGSSAYLINSLGGDHPKLKKRSAVFNLAHRLWQQD